MNNSKEVKPAKQMAKVITRERLQSNRPFL